MNIPYTRYNKIDNSTLDIAIDELERFAGYFGMTIGQGAHINDQPVEVTIRIPNFEHVDLINQLDDEDRTVVLKNIDTMLTRKKFKEFFNNNLAAFNQQNKLRCFVLPSPKSKANRFLDTQKHILQR